MNRRAVATLAYAIAASALALVIPKSCFVADSWIAASRSVRQLAKPGDLVLLYPAERMDRLGAFEDVWAVAVDSDSVGSLEHVDRIFWIGDAEVPPPAGFALQWSRRFGTVSVRLLSKPRPSS